MGDLGLIPGFGKSLREGKGYTLQYSGLENSMDYTVYSPRGHKELDVTEQLSLHFDYTIYYISVPNNDFHEKNFENSLMVLREF